MFVGEGLFGGCVRCEGGVGGLVVDLVDLFVFLVGWCGCGECCEWECG